MAVHQRREEEETGKAVRSWQFLKMVRPPEGRTLKIRASGALRQITPEKTEQQEDLPRRVPVRDTVILLNGLELRQRSQAKIQWQWVASVTARADIGCLQRSGATAPAPRPHRDRRGCRLQQGVGPLLRLVEHVAGHGQAGSFEPGRIGQGFVVHGVVTAHQHQGGRQARQALGGTGHGIRVLGIARAPQELSQPSAHLQAVAVPVAARSEGVPTQGSSMGDNRICPASGGCDWSRAIRATPAARLPPASSPARYTWAPAPARRVRCL
jgi:hypothetical protein